MLQFPSGQALFTCSMQIVYHQRMQLLGTLGRIEMGMPFTPPPDRACQILIDDGTGSSGSGITTESFPLCNQFTIQGDAFSRAVRGGKQRPGPAHGCDQEYGGDRSYSSFRKIGQVGNALT